MTDDINIQELKKEHPEFFEHISQNLLDFILSRKISSEIAEICLKNGVEDEETIEKVAYRIALILLDQIPKENLAIVLENGAHIDQKTARKIAIDVGLSIISKIETIDSEKAVEKIKKNQSSKSSLYAYVFPEEKPKGYLKKDVKKKPEEPT